MSRTAWSLPSSAIVACVVLAFAALGSWPARAQKTAADPLPGEYRIERGRVDRGTFNGWRIFHASCHGCHGVGAVGTDVGPNLVERIRNFTPRGFATKVLTSYRLVPMSPNGSPEERAAEREALLEEVLKRDRKARGQPMMPAWDDDEGVPPHVLDLYAYLSARADGEIGPGRPRVVAARKR